MPAMAPQPTEMGRMLGQIVQPLGRSLDGILHDVRTGRDSGTGEMMRLSILRADGAIVMRPMMDA